MEEDVVSQRVIELLEATGTKQSRLAEKLGIQRQALSRILKSGVAKSKHFPRIVNELGVTKEYLIFGNKKPALFVDNAQLKKLVQNNFVISEENKSQFKDFLINSELDSVFFAHELKISIDDVIKSGSLIIYASITNEPKKFKEIYILLSAINQSFIVGKYSKEGEDEYLVNKNGRYLVQSNDIFVGLAIQVMLYLGV